MTDILTLYPVIIPVIAAVMVLSAMFFLYLAYMFNVRNTISFLMFKLMPWVLAHLLVLGAGVILYDHYLVPKIQILGHLVG